MYFALGYTEIGTKASTGALMGEQFEIKDGTDIKMHKKDNLPNNGKKISLLCYFFFMYIILKNVKVALCTTED